MKELASGLIMTLSLTLSLFLSACVSVENKLSGWAIEGERTLASVEKKQVVVGDFTVPYLEGGKGETVF